MPKRTADTSKAPESRSSAPSFDPRLSELCAAEARLEALGAHIDGLLSTLATTPEDLRRVGERARAIGLHRLAGYLDALEHARRPRQGAQNIARTGCSD